MKKSSWLPLLMFLAGSSPGQPSTFDLDVVVSAGSPLDWLADIPRPVPTFDRTAAKESDRATRVEEPPHIRARDIFSFARITTIDLIGEIPWTVIRPQTKHAVGAYPPAVTDDVLWLALAVFLRKLLHPVQVNDLEAFEYLTYLGEPALAAAGMATSETGLRETIRALKKAVSPLPPWPPEVEAGESPLESMMLRLTVEDLVVAHPFSFDQKFAGRISLLGDEPIPYVIRASRSPHSFLRRNAAVMLGRYQDARCLERLRELLREETDPCVLARVVEALARRRDTASAGIFKGRLRGAQDRSFAASLIRGLGLLGDRTAVPAIIAVCEGVPRDFDIQVTGLTALARIAPPPSPDVERFLKRVGLRVPEDPTPRYAPVTPDAANSRETLIGQLIHLVKAAQGDSPSQVALLLSVHKARKDLAEQAAAGRRLYRGMLARFNPQVVYALLEILARFAKGVEILHDIASDPREDVVVRVHALIEFAKADSAERTERVRQLARLGEDPPVAETAFRLLCSYQPKLAGEAARELLAEYRPDMPAAQKSVLLLSMKHLSRRKEIQTEELIALAEGEMIHQEIDRARGKPPKNDSGNGMSPKFEFNSPVPLLEQIAIEIGRDAGPAGLEALTEILNCRASRARGEAAIGLGMLRDSKAWPALVAALDDEDSWVRLMAYRALKYSTGRDHPADWLYGTRESRAAAVEEYRKWLK
ncbi:MAG: HEAT repeat domain-containing protein [Planctomycetes bacterium]|nr:HEAT repeat domain-containing protein [Planctomycetota bacterium]